MHKSEVNRLKNEIWRLVLAQNDMRLVAEGARALLEDRYSHRELVEPGMVVVYCRSFSSPSRSGVRPTKTIVDRLAPEGKTHDLIFEMRHKLFAHTDANYRHRREAVDPFEQHEYAERSSPLHEEFVGRIRAIALALEDRFRNEREAREQALRDAGVPPDRYDWGGASAS